MIRVIVEIRYDMIDKFCEDLFVSYFDPIEYVVFNIRYFSDKDGCGYKFIAIVNRENLIQNLLDFRFIFPFCRARILEINEYLKFKEIPQHCRFLTTYEIEDVATFIAP